MVTIEQKMLNASMLLASASVFGITMVISYRREDKVQTIPTVEVKTAARPNASGLNSLVSIGITKSPRRAEAPDPENNVKTSFLNELCFKLDHPLTV